MKVLITVSTYYPRKDGVQNVTEYLAEGLVKKGHQVTVVTTDKNINNEYEVHNGVIIKRIDLYTKFGFYVGKIRKYKELINIETNNCDVMINVCTQNAFTDVILKNIENYKCKKILYVHGIFDFRFYKVNFSSLKSIINKIWKEIRWFFYYKLNGKYFKKYDKVIQLHEKDYGNIYFNKNYNINSVIIENAAENEFFERKTIDNFNKPFDKYIIYIANYDDNKNQKLAIEEFLKSNIDSKIGLVLMGSKKNEYYNYLEKLILKLRKKYKLKENEKQIKMLYDIDRKLVSSYVSNAYLYLMTSKLEKFPISIVETISCGVPYICTDVGIVKFFLGGIVSKKEDINYWINTLVNNVEYRDKLSNLCTYYAKEKFLIEDKVKILDEIINDLI